MRIVENKNWNANIRAPWLVVGDDGLVESEHSTEQSARAWVAVKMAQQFPLAFLRRAKQ